MPAYEVFISTELLGEMALDRMMAKLSICRYGTRDILERSGTSGFFSGAWPFGVAEAVWTLIAARRFRPTART